MIVALVIVGAASSAQGCATPALTGSLAVSPSAEIRVRSGLSEPYTLEEFSIHVLRSLAAQLGVAEHAAVTYEHTLALVAFGRGEGGGIAGSNRALYNPLNLNGWVGVQSHADLGGEHVPGTDRWPSFDAGVEATARALVRPQYERLAIVLTDPTSTADDFFFALAYKEFHGPGQKDWSANDKAHIAKYAGIVADLRDGGYGVWASKILYPRGTPAPGGTARPLTYPTGGTGHSGGTAADGGADVALLTDARECVPDTSADAGITIDGITYPPNLTGPLAHGYWRMPTTAAPDGTYVWSPGAPLAERCGSKTLVGVIYTAAVAYKAAYPDSAVRVGDLNAAPTHKTHNVGIDVDITTANRDAARMRSIGGGADTVQRSIALAKMFLATGQIRWIYYNDPAVQTAVNTYAAGNGLAGRMKTVSGHQDHFHVRLNLDHTLPFSNYCPEAA